jgi:hypothetical protein
LYWERWACTPFESMLVCIVMVMVLIFDVVSRGL